MELYTHSKLSTVQKERLELLKKPQIVEFVSFDSHDQTKSFPSPEAFRRYFINFYQSINPVGFALSSAQPSGVLGQGTINRCSKCGTFINYGNWCSVCNDVVDSVVFI